LADAERGLDQRLAELDEQTVAATVNALGPREVSFVFDRSNDSYIQRSHLLPDREELLREHQLGPLGAMNVHSDVACSGIGEKKFQYYSGSNLATLGVYPGPGVPAYELLSVGLLRRDSLRPEGEAVLGQDPDDPNLVHYTVDNEAVGTRHEYVLDARLGYCVTHAKLFSNGALMWDERCDFTASGEVFVPKRLEQRRYDQSGKVLSTRTYEIKSAEINVPISRDEFKIEVPPDAVLFDETSMTTHSSPFSPEALPEAELKGMLPVDAASLGERLLTDAANTAVEQAAEASFFSASPGEAAQTAPPPVAPSAAREEQRTSRPYTAYLGAFGAGIVLLAGYLMYRISKGKRK
jgi:hypothetical protein